jgi:hypothetical protein
MNGKSLLPAVIRGLLVAGLFSLVAGCSGNREYETAVCSLGDISGTYADQKPTVVNLI